MNVSRKTFEYQTEGQFHFVDVTDDVVEYVKSTGATDGLVHVYTPHTTTSLKINEKEEGFQLDFRDYMSELVPKKRYYRHNDLDIRDEKTLCEDINLCINGDSHIIQMLVGSSSETIPLVNGELAMGEWQRIFLIEVDKPRPRRIQVSVMAANAVDAADHKPRSLEKSAPESSVQNTEAVPSA